MSSTSEPVDEKELKECLKEAGLYEANMNQKEMLQCYSAIKSSRNSAQLEDEQRSLLEKTDNNCKALKELLLEENSPCSKSSKKQLSLSRKSSSDESDEVIIVGVLNTSRGKQQENSMNQKQVVITSIQDTGSYNFFDCPPLKHEPLNIISHDTKYRSPMYYDPEIQKLPYEERYKYVLNFHKCLLDKFYKLHRASVNLVAWPKPIEARSKFNSILDSSMAGTSNDLDLKEKKNETSDETLDDEKDKNEFIYTSRSGRQTKRKVYVENNEEEECKKSKLDEDNDFELHVLKQPVKRTCLPKLSNAEIMKRSKLFADKPKATRSEILFGKLAEQDKKMKAEEKKIKNLKNSIQTISDDEETDSDSQKIVEEIEIAPKPMTFIRRRVPPPQTKEKVKLKPYVPKFPERYELEQKKQEVEKRKTKCPICSEVFPEHVIERHASSCGCGMDMELNFETVPRDT